MPPDDEQDGPRQDRPDNTSTAVIVPIGTDALPRTGLRASAERFARIAAYRARAQRSATHAMDRFIAHTYGPEWVSRSRS